MRNSSPSWPGVSAALPHRRGDSGDQRHSDGWKTSAAGSWTLGFGSCPAQASAFGADAYPDLATKAAALLHSLVLNHAFIDGNKRTAVLAALVFLDLNGYTVRWDHGHALDFVLGVAVHQMELEEAAAFLRSRMHPK